MIDLTYHYPGTSVDYWLTHPWWLMEMHEDRLPVLQAYREMGGYRAADWPNMERDDRQRQIDYLEEVTGIAAERERREQTPEAQELAKVNRLLGF